MALRARARAADKCSRGLRRPRDMEGVLDIRRPEVEVVVGPVVRRGDVREAREGGRRGRARVAARVAVRGQEEPRLWESRAGDDLVDALVDGDREGARSSDHYFATS